MLLGFGLWSYPFLSDYVERYEAESARVQLVQARAVIERAPDRTARADASWSAWGARYDFAKPRDTAWEREFAGADTLRALDVDALAILDAKKRLRGAFYLDSSARAAELPVALRNQLDPDSVLLRAPPAEPTGENRRIR